MEKIKPVRDLVLCRVLDHKPKQTPAGVLLPIAYSGREEIAEVLAVGAGGADHKGRLTPPQVKPGDQVYFDPYKLEWSEHGGTTSSCYAGPGDHMLIRERNIRGVLDVALPE